MACIRCQRRNRVCDDKRPRCGFCRSSRVRCRYDRRAAILQTRRELRRRIPTDELPSPTERSETSSISERPADRPPMVRRFFTTAPISIAMQQECLFAKFLAAWDDGFPHIKEMADLEQTAAYFNVDEPGLQLPPPYNMIGKKYTEEEIRQGILSVTWPSELVPSATQCRSLSAMPDRLLTQHRARIVDGQLTYARPDWTYYTYFFHRFQAKYRCVLAAIQAWSTATLHFADRKGSMDEGLRQYDESLSMMLKMYGITTISPIDAEERRSNIVNLAISLSSEDRDALFVAYFFLALFDLMVARQQNLRATLHLIAAFLRDPGFRSNMSGVQARVACWFCLLDGKASAFQRDSAGGGMVVRSIGQEENLIATLSQSHLTIQQAFRTTRTEKEQTAVNIHFVLQDLMLRLTCLLHQITDAKHIPNTTTPAPQQGQEQQQGQQQSQQQHPMHAIRYKLDIYKQAINSNLAPIHYEDKQCHTAFLIMSALYHALEISFSRCLRPTDARHAASHHALTIVQVAQKLKNLQPEGLVSASPWMKIWPLPLVMAGIEIQDLGHREWAVQLLASFESIPGNQYVRAKKFVETVCQREDKAGARVDWEGVMREVDDGLVV